MTHHTCRVLLVEDSSEEALLFSQAVHRAGVPWSLRFAAGRHEAIDAMTRPSAGSDGHEWSEPDIVVLDVRLRDSSGFHVLRWIRTQLKERMIPVIVFTGSVEPGVAEQAREYGGTGFIEKPEDLDGAIEAVIKMNEKWCKSRLSPCTGKSSHAT